MKTSNGIHILPSVDRDKVKKLDNLPKNLKGRKYFISKESSTYERALNQNHLNIESKKGYK
jgi:hypothetical protein